MQTEHATWEADRCPSCLERQGVMLDDVTRLCFVCRYEWRPADTDGPLDPDKLLAAMSVVDDDEFEDAPIVDTLDVSTLDDVIATYVGRDVVWHDAGATGTVTAIDDEGRATITFGSGYFIVADPDEFSILPDTSPPDDVIAALGTADLYVAGIIVKAAVETCKVDADVTAIGLPPDGYLDPDPEMFIVCEHAAAYAVAVVAKVCGLSLDDLARIGNQLTEAADAAREATEHDQH